MEEEPSPGAAPGPSPSPSPSPTARPSPASTPRPPRRSPRSPSAPAATPPRSTTRLRRSPLGLQTSPGPSPTNPSPPSPLPPAHTPRPTNSTLPGPSPTNTTSPHPVGHSPNPISGGPSPTDMSSPLPMGRTPNPNSAGPSPTDMSSPLPMGVSPNLFRLDSSPSPSPAPPPPRQQGPRGGGVGGARGRVASGSGGEGGGTGGQGRARARSGGGTQSNGYSSPLEDLGTPGATPASMYTRRTPLRERNDLGGRGAAWGARRTPRHEEEGPNPTQDDTPPEEDQTFIWGTTISAEDVQRRFQKFLTRFRDSGDSEGEELLPKYIRMIDELVDKEGDIINIDCANIHSFDPQLYEMMVKYPMEVVPLFDFMLEMIAMERGRVSTDPLYTRVFNLKEKVNMRNLNPSDIDRMVSIRGMIIRCSPVVPDIKAAFFRCSICGHTPEEVVLDRGRIQEPTVCVNEACAAKGAMQIVHNRCRFADKQIVRLQETPDAIPEGETPYTVTLCVFDRLVDACKPGDRVEVTGVFRASAVRESSTRRALKSLYKTYVDCIHIKKTDKKRLAAEDQTETDINSDSFAPLHEDDTLEDDIQKKADKLKALAAQPDIYQILTRSIAPSIWELEDIKKGLLCQLFGGSTVSSKADGAPSLRADLNVLLVGDPGTSKSQLLQYTHKIAPRGIYTSGRGSSAVGLTAYVTRDPETREMILESGALVLSDRGICCIDEFDKMSENARSMLHEVMEQQTVSVAKAGIIAVLNARTSVLASANPVQSRYNPRLSVIDNIQLPPSLLSRFDLIYLVLDKADEVTDRRLARHLVALHYEEQEARDQSEIMDVSTLTAFITYARQKVHPQLTEEAASDLVENYVEMRMMGGNRKTITATPRQLESLIRIAESLAKMRFSETVERADVAEAFRLLKVAMQQSATDHRTGMIDMDLINTGVSASERTRREQMVALVRDMLSENVAPGSTTLRVTQILEMVKHQKQTDVQLNEVRDALTVLMAEGFLTMTVDNVRRL